VLELLDEERPLRPRPHERHLPLEDVPELGQLVEVVPAEEPAERRAARIVLARPDRPRVLLGADGHRTELGHGEGLAVEPHPFLPVEDRPRRGHPDQGRDDGAGQGEHQERGARECQVDQALERAVQPLERHVRQVDDGNPVEILETRPERDDLKQKDQKRDLAQALKELYKSSSEIKVIGTRHGEKLYETLVNREEMVKAIDEEDYYRIPADIRDLNYNKFFTEGESKVSQTDEYTSHNTKRLDVEGTKQLLLKLHSIREDILKEKRGNVYTP